MSSWEDFAATRVQCVWRGARVRRHIVHDVRCEYEAIASRIASSLADEDLAWVNVQTPFFGAESTLHAPKWVIEKPPSLEKQGNIADLDLRSTADLEKELRLAKEAIRLREKVD